VFLPNVVQGLQLGELITYILNDFELESVPVIAIRLGFEHLEEKL
jgi:hypothetical protein